MNWLEESVKRSKKLKDHYMLKGIDIYVKDQLPQDIDVDFVIKYVAKRLPDHVLSNIDIIYIGHFQDLVDRDINALWQNGAIYITNDQDNEMDMIDDLIHEIAHSNEKQFEQIIYEDGKLEQEFLYRRKKLAFWKGNPTVKISTFHSFKGWEARLLVINVTEIKYLMDSTLFYIGLTRVKKHPKGSFLSIVTPNAELKNVASDVLGDKYFLQR